MSIVVPAGNYVLTIIGAGEEMAETGDLDITDAIDIRGTTDDPRDVIVNAAGFSPDSGAASGDRVFHVHGVDRNEQPAWRRPFTLPPW